MISFNEWINEISSAGSLSLPEMPSMRRQSKLVPDSSAGRIFKVRLDPSVLSMMRSFGTDSGGMPKAVQDVLGSMDGGFAMMSNEDMTSVRGLSSEMRREGGLMSQAARELDGALEDSIRTAVG